MITGIVLIWLSVVAGDGIRPPEVIHFEGTTGRSFEAPGVYPRVYSGGVEFPHGTHFTDQGVGCSVCHHMDEFDPDIGLESEVEITHCIDCHDATGLVYGRQADELDESDLMMHRPNVMHTRCVGCHEDVSAANGAIVAPIACRGCHSQRQRDYTLTD